MTELLLPLSKIAIPISPEITRGRQRQYTEQGKLPAGCHVKCLRPRGSGFSVSTATLLASWFRAHGSGLTVLTSRFSRPWFWLHSSKAHTFRAYASSFTVLSSRFCLCGSPWPRFWHRGFCGHGSNFTVVKTHGFRAHGSSFTVS